MMHEIHRTTLQRSRTFLVKNLLLTPVLDILVENEIFREESDEICRSAQSKGEGIRRFLLDLPRCGSQAFSNFILALFESNQEEVKKYIDKF